jgi:hypothetical protein
MDNTNAVAKDERYRLIKPLIESVEGFTFESIFKHIPKKVVATDLGIPYTTFLKKIKIPKGFQDGELLRMSALFGLRKDIIPQLIEGYTPAKWPIRYAALGIIIKEDFATFQTIFSLIPMGILARDTGISYKEFRRKVHQPELFTEDEIGQMAKLFKAPPEKVAKLINDAILSNHKGV